MAKKERLAHTQTAPPSRKWNLILALVAALSLAWAMTRSAASKGSVVAQAAGSVPAAGPAQAVTAEELTWTNATEVQGSLKAVLWGDPLSGAYGAWNKWPAGSDGGTRTQSADSKVVVMAGTIVLSLDGGPAKELGAGSYIHVPANQVRSMKCKPGTDCIFFTEQPDKFDFIPANPPEKK